MLHHWHIVCWESGMRLAGRWDAVHAYCMGNGICAGILERLQRLMCCCQAAIGLH